MVRPKTSTAVGQRWLCGQCHRIIRRTRRELLASRRQQRIERDSGWSRRPTRRWNTTPRPLHKCHYWRYLFSFWCKIIGNRIIFISFVFRMLLLFCSDVPIYDGIVSNVHKNKLGRIPQHCYWGANTSAAGIYLTAIFRYR